MTEIKIDEIRRSNRKTISLVVMQDGRLVVYAPRNIPMDYITDLVVKKRPWIEKRQKTLEEIRRKRRPREFADGNSFLFLGRNYRLRVVDGDGDDIKLGHGLSIPRTILPQAEDYLIMWYKRQAQVKIPERVNWYAKLTGLQYKSIRITDAATRLGSCGPKGTLNFSWRLVMAPLSIIDYVVVHELSHLEHRNHSTKFWDTVRTILPDYEQRKKWLKKNGNLLALGIEYGHHHRG